MCNNLAVIAKHNRIEALKAKVKLGLIYGREKGKRGTGVMHNGRLVKSHDFYYNKSVRVPANHDSLDFVEDLWFFDRGEIKSKFPKDYHVFMGHNRSPSTGMGSGAEFVHPFVYGEEVKEGNKTTLINRMWFQHNGTIDNIRDVAAKYNLNFHDFKNDSYLLGHLLYQGIDPKELFEFAQGGLTCIWYWESDYKLRVFKGGIPNDKGELEAQRPLYMLKTKDEIWFNTISHIITIITDWDLEVDTEEVPTNKILTIDQDFNIEEREVTRLAPPKKQLPPPRRNKYFPFENQQQKVSIPDCRTSYNQVVWYDGYYYFNGGICHGAYNLDAIGNISSSGDIYYFYQGWLLKDIEHFYKALKQQTVYCNWFHNKALHMAGDKKLYYSGKDKAHGKVKSILFYPFGFRLNKGVIVSATETSAGYYKRSNLPYRETKVWLDNYNAYYGTEFETIGACRGHYRDINKFYSFHNNFWEYDFANICTDVTSLLEDPICELYNELNKTKFLTRHQCQFDFFLKNSIYKPENSNFIEFYNNINYYLAQLKEDELQDNLI